MSEQTQEQDTTYDEFEKIIKDFLKDILRTFPEYADTMNEDLRRIVCEEDDDKSSVQTVFEYCQSIYPKRFFDILYQNNELFSNENENENEEKKSFLLPDIDFKELWKCDLSEHTRTTIWKYLQLILFSVIGNMSDGDSFGDTAKLFEAINEDEFKSKLEDEIADMWHFLLSLTIKAGLGPNDIMEAYETKWKINFVRQNDPTLGYVEETI